MTRYLTINSDLTLNPHLYVVKPHNNLLNILSQNFLFQLSLTANVTGHALHMYWKPESKLPLTDQRDTGSAHAKYSVSHSMVIKQFLPLGLAVKYRSRQWMWSTVVQRPTEVNDTHRRTNLTVPETISHSSFFQRWLKSPFKPTPPPSGALLGVKRWNCAEIFSIKKLEYPGYSMALFSWS